jgi:dihydroxy-acid dehydratase
MGKLDRDVLTVNGKTIWENNYDAPCYNDEVIRPLDRPLVENGGICILKGNLAPRGAVLKPSAASRELMNHRGRAVVFENFDHYKERIIDPDLDIDESCVMVMKNCGPKGYPGMAEVGNMGLPPKLLRRGVKDMVRISDARMSGTAFGTVVLHVAPEAMELGPLAAVRDGDMIQLDADRGHLHLEVADEELAARLEQLKTNRVIASSGGYLEMYRERVLQADEGCDFDFLVGCRGAEVPPHSH